MHNEIANFINAKVSSAAATVEKGEAGDAWITVNAKDLYQVCDLLKNSSEWGFKVLEVISGIDYADRIEVAYLLATFNPAKDLEIILKVKLNRENPEVDSVVNIWRAANFQERECFDMLGVNFKGHPDFRRILCPEDWKGFPLRKDYVVEKFYNGMEVNPEHKMNIPDREFAAKQKAAEKAAAPTTPAQ